MIIKPNPELPVAYSMTPDSFMQQFQNVPSEPPVPIVSYHKGNVPDMSPITEQPKISEPVGQKWDAGKTDPTLLFEGTPLALALVTRVLDYGFAKYKMAHGWAKVPNAIVRYSAAAARHMMYRSGGESHDPESGLLHEAHEITNRLFVLEMKLRELSRKKLAKEMQYNEPPTDGK